MSAERDLMLVAPWYRWPRQTLPARQTRPVLQKYDIADPMSAFRKDPQRSLKFIEDDLVHSVVKAPALPSLPVPLQNLQRRLSPLTSVPTDVRKLFLETHKRSYLVVCELHVDDPGFPCVDRREVCEAGFVIRRRKVTFPAEAEAEVRDIVGDLGAASAELAQVQRRADGMRMAIVRDGADRPAVVALTQAIAQRRDGVDLERRRLAEWADRVGARRTELGWEPDPTTERIGRWKVVDAEPQELTETTVRLYPLVPATPDENTSGVTLYFGLVPTGTADATVDGTARFDDETLYQIRCYVRRHDPGCPRTSKPGDCHGELIWSRPTDPYRLASHFDLTGTSNRPVTVQLPDLQALEAEAAMGRGAPFRLKSPERSNLVFENDPTTMMPIMIGRDAAFCSFAIPLITIVATFLFKLFLPIIVISFQLWFLLKLRFCIPPTVEIGGGGALDAAIAGSLDVDLDASVKIGLEDEFEIIVGPGAGPHLTGEYSNQVLIDLRKDLAKDMSLPSFAPSFTAGLEYETPVLRAEASLR